jgi:hypothetical protein
MSAAPSDTDSAMQLLRSFAYDQPVLSATSFGELATMSLPDAFVRVRSDLAIARRMLQLQLALAMEDEPPSVRIRRVGIIEAALADLTHTEVRLDRVERGVRDA